LIRFTLDAAGGAKRVWVEWNKDASEAWLWQAWSVFLARGMSLEDDLSALGALLLSIPFPFDNPFQRSFTLGGA